MPTASSFLGVTTIAASPVSMLQNPLRESLHKSPSDWRGYLYNSMGIHKCETKPAVCCELTKCEFSF